MIELGRPSQLKGAGFYDYDETGTRAGLWPGLAEPFPVAEEQIPIQDIQDRMLFVEAIETARASRRASSPRPPRPTSARSSASASRPTPVARPSS